MITKEEIIKELFNFNIIHGRQLCGDIINQYLENVVKTKIKIDKNLFICTVIDKNSFKGSCLHKIQFDNEYQIHFIIVDKYTKWITKVLELYDFIRNNYDKLPKYILYLDGMDTLILKDIVNPSEYLDFYDCKILFNIENQYAGTGYEGPYPMYLNDFYNDDYNYFLKRNNEKYKNELPYGLNAGVFLGEKKYVLDILEEAFYYMIGDINNGFPNGCTDDQYVFRYLHNRHYDIISADVFHKFSFWGGRMSYTDEKFKPYYNNQFLEKYLNKNEGI
jgi:hypothetical protein